MASGEQVCGGEQNWPSDEGMVIRRTPCKKGETLDGEEREAVRVLRATTRKLPTPALATSSSQTVFTCYFGDMNKGSFRSHTEVRRWLRAFIVSSAHLRKHTAVLPSTPSPFSHSCPGLDAAMSWDIPAQLGAVSVEQPVGLQEEHCGMLWICSSTEWGIGTLCN